MFEQSTLTNVPAGKRMLTSLLGFTMQTALVSFAILVPMVFPQVLPTTRILETLTPPLPPAPRPLGEVKHQPSGGRPVSHVPWAMRPYAPTTVPGRVIQLVDEPDAFVRGVPVGFNGPETGVVGNILEDMERNTVRVAPPPVVVAAPKPAAVEPTAPARYRVGGNVHLGTLLHRVEPAYPALARSTHMQGDVTLECVVGTDGHIREVKVTSGNPLLIKAAVDAAWQWVYAPSKLNDTPIEIITILTFSFKLN